jgi:hypothetical protein
VSTYHYLPILIFRLLSYVSVFFYLFLTLWLEKIPIGFLNSAFLNSFSASKRMSRAGGGAVPHIVKGFGRSDIIAQSRPADTKVGVCLKPTFR